ncbi:hypothetical protein [Microbacterium sp. SS28]|uniref:hypothetical protein n=1 Tax=Microbacterium sp. SS28 TaxID=2919948 RepID=UPI001FAB2176|nr:hypothetical protein [Microbacterium sp. SS28]
MPLPLLVRTSERLVDASVVTRATDIAGSRHEVLPPRAEALRADVLYRSYRHAPP